MNRTFMTVAALAAATWATACGGGKPPAQQTPPPPQVTVVALAPKTLEMAYAVPGRLQGSREVEVRARVKGILQS